MHNHHLSDRDLVLALDGELTIRRHAAVDAHLAECPSCRSRRTALRELGEGVTSLSQSTSLDAEAIAASREQLRSKLDMARRQEAPIIERLAAPFGHAS